MGGAGLQAALLLSSQQGLEPYSPPLDTPCRLRGPLVGTYSALISHVVTTICDVGNSASMLAVFLFL